MSRTYKNGKGPGHDYWARQVAKSARGGIPMKHAWFKKFTSRVNRRWWKRQIEKGAKDE